MCHFWAKTLILRHIEPENDYGTFIKKCRAPKIMGTGGLSKGEYESTPCSYQNQKSGENSQFFAPSSE